MPTRKEVADLAGVSEVTVSRALSQNGYVSPEKKNLVNKAAEQLGYQPNPIAVSFKKNKTKQILLLLPEQDFENSFFVTLYKGAVRYAEKAGYLLAVSTDMMFSKITKKMFDGVILANSSFAPDELRKHLRVPAAVLNFGEEIYYPWLENVIVDTGLAMELVIKHLNALGHRRIAFAMPRHTLMRGTFSQRYQHYSDLLRGVFTESIDEYVFGIDLGASGGKLANYYHYGRIAAEQIYEKKPDITAVACFNDEVALGLMGRLQSLGIKVPEDLSVAGIDNILQSAYGVPPLTTVNLPAVEQGEESVRRLICRIEGKDIPEKAAFNIAIVPRESVRSIK
ncbi:MAG: LacI family transcriptional regulator [Treponema sp.]|nr:LacI family transcriptional regulator [Treponema sp.]